MAEHRLWNVLLSWAQLGWVLGPDLTAMHETDEQRHSSREEVTGTRRAPA
jgi:hypothetical protein